MHKGSEDNRITRFLFLSLIGHLVIFSFLLPDSDGKINGIGLMYDNAIIITLNSQPSNAINESPHPNPLRGTHAGNPSPRMGQRGSWEREEKDENPDKSLNEEKSLTVSSAFIEKPYRVSPTPSAGLDENLSDGKGNGSDSLQNGFNDDYTAVLKEAIKRNTYYPVTARKRGIEGSVITSFSVQKNGGVIDIKVIKSSGSSILDTAAMDIIERSSPVTPSPKDTLDVKLPLVFSLKKRSIISKIP